MGGLLPVVSQFFPFVFPFGATVAKLLPRHGRGEEEVGNPDENLTEQNKNGQIEPVASPQKTIPRRASRERKVPYKPPRKGTKGEMTLHLSAGVGNMSSRGGASPVRPWEE